MPPPLSPPVDITIPEPGSETARTILSRSILRLIPEFFLAGRSLRLSPEAQRDFSTFAAFFRDLAAKNKGVLPSLARRVHIAALVRSLRTGGRESVLRELLGVCYFELARLSALPTKIKQAAPPQRIVSPTAGLVITFPADTKAVIYENGAITIEGDKDRRIDLEALVDKEPGFAATLEGVNAKNPFFEINEHTKLALADNNPLSMFEAHPDKEGNAIDLGGKDVQEWTTMLKDAFSLVAEFLPDLRREMDLLIQQIVPVGYHPQKHLSASYQEAIGTIYMTLHPNLMTMTEALIHEFSHNKINALFEVDPLLHNAFSPLYTSPVRPDPRPLHGVLLAVHAFLPVARLYERMIDAGHPLAKRPGFEQRFADVRKINAEGAAVVLENGKPTEIGRGVLDEIRRWDAYFAAFDRG